MVDTLTVIAFSPTHLPLLDAARETTSKRTGLTGETGTFGGLRVFLREDGLLSLRGSLATYHFGDNVRTMTRADVRAAVASLTDAFGLDPSECRVYRLDLAATLPMHCPPVSYFPVLDSYPRMEREDFHGKGVAFYNTRRRLSFYDKSKQAKIEGRLLRFEVQHRKKVAEQVGFPLTLADLADADRFAFLVGRWQAEYGKVSKRQRPRLAPTPTPSDLRRQLASIGLSKLGGCEALLPTIDTWRLDRRQTHRLRQEVRSLAGLGDDTDDGALLRELDAAIAEAARYALTN